MKWEDIGKFKKFVYWHEMVGQITKPTLLTQSFSGRKLWQIIAQEHYDMVKIFVDWLLCKEIG